MTLCINNRVQIVFKINKQIKQQNKKVYKHTFAHNIISRALSCIVFNEINNINFGRPRQTKKKVYNNVIYHLRLSTTVNAKDCQNTISEAKLKTTEVNRLLYLLFVFKL